MGPDPVTFSIGPGPRQLLDTPGAEPEPESEQELTLRRLERIGTRIMNQSGGGGMFGPDPLGALKDGGKRASAAQLLGQAYVTAYVLAATNREALERIADTLVQRKEMHGDEVTELLDSVGLRRPEFDLTDETTWPTV
jgi:hypothetical protein